MRRLGLFFVAAVLLSGTAAAQSTCTASTFTPTGAAQWSGWGLTAGNTRHAGSAGLSAADVPKLELKWAFGFPGVRAVIGQPSIIGNRVFIGVDTGEVYSLDANTGCVYWTFKADAGVRTAPVVDMISGEPSLFIGDLGGQVYALNAVTGALKWKVEVDPHATARITGSPQFHRLTQAGVDHAARLYVPVASGEEGSGASPNYKCCTFRGSIVALDAATGEQVWKTYVIQDEPRETLPGKFGPSGAGIWSAPTIDAARGQLYAATGDAYSAPADKATDAIVAMDLVTGAIRWIAQETENDIWLSSCMRPNAPEDCGPDHDFGSPAMLVSPNLLVAGQKSGNVWAHNPDTGAVIWRTPMVDDTTQFGGKIVWGGSADEAKAYFGLGPGGIGAIQLRDGEKQWFTELPAAAGMETHTGHEGPLTSIDGAVFSGGFDGVLRALDSSSGKVIWQFNTARAFDTVNGVEAKGGSMGAAGPVVAYGKLFVPSGYIGVKNGVPGNVLLMFAPGN